MIRILIVDDSRVAREFLAYLLTSEAGIEIAGFASNGAEALTAVKYLRPDVVTMDIHMGLMNGYEATRDIMENIPTPIVIVSGSASANESPGVFQALEAGALAVVLRPPGIGHPDHLAAAKGLIQTVKMMAAIKVIKRHARAPRAAVTAPLRALMPAAGNIELVAIGASIGGPPVLNTILSRLPPGLPVPLLIVQHIASGFAEGFMDWLSEASHFPLHLATHGMRPEPGHGYIAPDGYHLGVTNGLRLVLSDAPPDFGSRPSVAHLFRSVAEALGPQAIGVLLTGMGTDGADGLRLLKNAGAPTIAQDEASSVVHGMPGAAIALGAADYILPPEGIAAMLASLTKNSRRSAR